MLSATIMILIEDYEDQLWTLKSKRHLILETRKLKKMDK